MPTTPPTTDELRALVATQLRQYGIDISVLPPGGPGLPSSDPVTGVPTQYSLIGSCVSVITGSVTFIAGYKVDAGYKQNVQDDPPVLYPAPFSAWTR
jgi:hypothetical protein